MGRNGQGRRAGGERRGSDEGPARPRGEAPSRSSGGRPDGRSWLWGYHAAREALRAGRRELFVLWGAPAALEKLAPEIAASGVTAKICDPRDLDARLGAGAVHQGVLLEAGPAPELDVTEIETRSGIVVALDQITDPHNVGAILRTCAAFAVDAVVMTERHSPELSGVLAKAACGGLEHVGIVRVVNLARALDELGEAGYWRLGLDSAESEPLTGFADRRPVVLVLGAEGAGLRRLTRERCDAMVRLDMPGAIKSLNVSNACAVALATLAARAPQV